METVRVEIRSAEGGDDAKLFAENLYQMYEKFCKRMGFQLEQIRNLPGRVGFSEIDFKISGENVYS